MHRCSRRIFIICKFVCAHASYTHPRHFVPADVRAIRRKLLTSTTNTFAHMKSSRGQAYNKLEININLSSYCRHVYALRDAILNTMSYLLNRSIFCITKSEKRKRKPKF